MITVFNRYGFSVSGNMTKRGLKSRNFFLIIVIAIIYVFARLINLDADAPAFKLMNLQAIDEFYYSIGAFNLFHYNNFVNTVIPYAENDASPFMLLLNFFTAFTLKLFGNTYFGLRFGSGLCSLVLFLLFVNTLKRTSFFWDNHLVGLRSSILNYMLIVLLFFFAIDFSFLCISRTADPTISRSLILVFLIWYVASNDIMLKSKPYLYSFLLGFLALSSVCFVYTYNLFFVGAAGLTMLLIAFKNKSSFSFIAISISFFVLGAIVCCLFFECFVQVFFKKSFLDYLDLFSTISNARVNKDNSGFVAYIMKVKSMFFTDFGTNMFRLNLPFFILIMLALPVYFYRTFKLKKNVDIFLSSLFVLWIAQSFFENTYPLKRHTLMFPVFVLILIYSFEEISNFVDFISRHKLSRILYLTYSLFVICVVIFTSYVFYNTCQNDFPELKSFWVVNVTSGFVMFLMFLYAFWPSGPNIKTVFYSLFLLLVPSCYLFFNKIIVNATYHYKKSMVDIEQKVGNQVVAGGVAYAFRLYNSTRPTLNTYAYQYTDIPELKKRMGRMLDATNYLIMTTNNIRENPNAKVSPMEVGFLPEIAAETGCPFKLEKVYFVGDRYILLLKKQSLTWKKL